MDDIIQAAYNVEDGLPEDTDDLVKELDELICEKVETMEDRAISEARQQAFKDGVKHNLISCFDG